MAAPTLNFNIGVLGHVDSGKTSLAKALSTVASTACFDKNPQSRERGITLDLGFSCFSVDMPAHIKDDSSDQMQITLVDCPGHASLIKAIIGGAQIIDMMMLVIDVTKGMQTQTAECLVIGEITCNKMLVVLNKIDMIPENKRKDKIEKMSKRIMKTLESTKFNGCQVIPVAAKPGGPEAPDSAAIGINELIDAIRENSFKPRRSPEGNLIFSVDHCFSIRGQGTVMTGTLLGGQVAVNDTVEIPALKITKKVKSMQMFKKPITKAIQGDRLGMCVTQFDPKLLERGLVCTPGALPTICAAIISVEKISYFKGAIATKTKFHVTLGHETTMARVAFFGYYGDEAMETDGVDTFDFDGEYQHQDCLIDVKKTTVNADEKLPSAQYALLEFEKSVTCATNTLVIGSKLDTDIHTNTCRLAFHGKLLEIITDIKYHDTVLPRVKICKNKTREGVVERKMDDQTVICKGLFKKETNLEVFTNLKVTLSTGEKGVIEGGFGQSGKFKVRIQDGLLDITNQILTARAKKGKGKKADDNADVSGQDTQIKVILMFRRYLYDPKKKMIQA